jgi:histidyl-tRNA synthetase
MTQYRKIKGTRDILPEESPLWIKIEQEIHHIMNTYNYTHMRTPIFETTALFARGIGQLTDIVSKEMYTFIDRGKKSLTLKPEMTAPIIRAYLENKLYAQKPLNKLYYISPLFRQENPQAGRLRQFHQFGAEALGSSDPAIDADIIKLALTVYSSLGLKNLSLKINSVGDQHCRVPYKKLLQDYIRPNLDQYCADCQKRFEENPMRILDCKNDQCNTLSNNAPKISQHLCDDCNTHFEQLQSILNNMNIVYEKDSNLVRGLDYYTRTVFEITSDDLGSQNAICGGGRYDLLAEELGGQSTPAVGFASGIERLMMVMEKQQLQQTTEDRLHIFLIGMGDEAKKIIHNWLYKLRDAGLRSDMDYLERSVKAQMREANRQKARFVVILGDDELKNREFSLKLMDKNEQLAVPFDELITYIKKNS